MKLTKVNYSWTVQIDSFMRNTNTIKTFKVKLLLFGRIFRKLSKKVRNDQFRHLEQVFVVEAFWHKWRSKTKCLEMPENVLLHPLVCENRFRRLSKMGIQFKNPVVELNKYHRKQTRLVTSIYFYLGLISLMILTADCEI